MALQQVGALRLRGLEGQGIALRQRLHQHRPVHGGHVRRSPKYRLDAIKRGVRLCINRRTARESQALKDRTRRKQVTLYGHQGGRIALDDEGPHILRQAGLVQRDVRLSTLVFDMEARKREGELEIPQSHVQR